MTIHTVCSLNHLPEEQKRAVYMRILPPALLQLFQLPPNLVDEAGHDLLRLNAPPGSSWAEMELRHRYDFPDPVFYGQIADTMNGQIHVLFYVLNDPSSPRFSIDCLPDGTPTTFGTRYRNLEAETQALAFGLAPGQVRRGLRMLGQAIQTFEAFVDGLGHTLFFAEPLYYHNAILFERYGFAYERGRKLMERVHTGFASGGELLDRLDNSTPFRSPEAAHHIRLRSWALHDGLLENPFTNVTMYKWVGKSAEVDTCPECVW